MRSIVLFGLFGGANIGNNATLQAMLAAVRARIPAANIVVVAPRGSRVQSMYGVSHIEMDPLPAARWLWRVQHLRIGDWAWRVLQVLLEPLRMRRARAALRGAEGFFVAGTGVIDEFGQTSLNLPLDLHRWTHAARRNSVPVYFLSVGVEPIRARLARALFLRSMRGATWISVRDEFSWRQIRDLGVAVPMEAIYPDLAFSLRTAAREPATATHIVVGVMGYVGWNQPQAIGERIYADYIRRTRALVDELLLRGHCVTLVIGDAKADPRAADDVRNSFDNHPQVSALNADVGDSVEGLLQRFAAAAVVIAARFHNVLLALLAGCKVISLGYSKKNDALLTALGEGRYCYDIENFDPIKVVEDCTELLRTAPSGERAALIDDWRRRLESQYDQVLRG